MGQLPENQNKLYDVYWAKIERCTGNDVSSFIRDYLSIKRQITPTISNVYKDFKEYAVSTNLPVEDLLRYARLFEKLSVCKSGLQNQKLDGCLYRLMRLEIVVTRPFLMEVLRLNQDNKLNTDDVLQIFLVTENYLFRRNICDVPTNALNKIFLNLNKEIIRYDGTTDNYVQKFIYTLLSKKDSGRFPDDKEFSTELSVKPVYQMRGKYKAYLFERFENYGTVETKDVYTHLDNNIYSIEHIMAQHLTPAWIESLGENALEIHSIWLHRLANLTLTGYNPYLSNKTFDEKLNAEKGGYKNSGLKMNQKISSKKSWGLEELEERNAEMIALAKKIWAYPQTTFVPAKKEFYSCTRDDENIELTGRNIVKYGYQNLEQSVNTWSDMMEHVIKYLHQKDKSVLADLAYNASAYVELSNYVSNDKNKLRSPLKIDNDIYIERNTSTALKISILRRLFVLYNAEPADLVFYLKDTEKENEVELTEIAAILREWVVACKDVNENLDKCNRTYTRFTTNSMSEIIPDIHDAPSGWNTANHYFYEIVNRTGRTVYIQLSLSSRNATKEFLELCERINEYYPAKFSKEDWQWRSPFKTASIAVNKESSKEEIFARLDACLEEVKAFEEDLKEKFKNK